MPRNALTVLQAATSPGIATLSRPVAAQITPAIIATARCRGSSGIGIGVEVCESFVRCHGVSSRAVS